MAKKMNKREFIEQLRTMADQLEQGSFHFIDLPTGWIFGNKNYGEVSMNLAEGVYVKVNLYHADEDEKEDEEE